VADWGSSGGKGHQPGNCRPGPRMQYLFDFHEISRCTPTQGAAGAANIYILFRKNKKESAKKCRWGKKESRAKMPPLPPPRPRLAHRRFNPIKTIHFIWDGMKNPGGQQLGRQM